jgi:hypothetical protein
MAKAATKATAVAKADTAQLPAVASMLDDMEADAVLHRPVFERDMLSVPRIKLLQDLSPAVKEHNAEYVPGARPGMILNELLNSLDSEIIFVPARFDVRYIAWRPRKAGGGLVDPNLTREEVDLNFTQEGIGKWTGMMRPSSEEDPIRVEVLQTPEYVGIAKGKNWGPTPVAISLPSTKVKAAKKMNTTIDLFEMDGKNGRFRPPMFYHQFRLATALEKDGDDEFWGFVVHHMGVGIDADLVRRAKELKIAFDDNKAVVDDSTLDK